MEIYTIQTCVRGYHIYKEVWEAPLGQLLLCQRELGNVHDPYAVAVVDTRGIITLVVGHVRRAISSVCYFFLGRSGTITCEVTGLRQYYVDLPQGGLNRLTAEIKFPRRSQDTELFW